MSDRSRGEIDLVEDVLAHAGRSGLFDGGERLLVACSGGPDSTVLLDLLVRIRRRGVLEPPPRLAVAHLHHGLRGREADRDAAFVEEMARDLELPVFVERAQLDEGAGSLEAAARRARLRFFRRLLRRWDGDAVALGHTRDDQAETVLLNLIRGTGLRGLGGMEPRSEVRGVPLLRPLLAVRRAALLRHAEAHGIGWLEDSSNADPRFLRNRLRQRVLPLLEEIRPGATDRVARAAELLRDEETALREAVDRIAAEAIEPDEYPGAVAVRLTPLRELGRGLARRLVRRGVERVRGDLRGIEAAHVDGVLDDVVAGAVEARDLPGVRVARERELLRMLPLRGRRLAPPGEDGGGSPGENGDVPPGEDGGGPPGENGDVASGENGDVASRDNGGDGS